MSLQFTSPATSGGAVLKPADLNGHLLVVEPEEFIENMPTSMGTSDAIRVTVHDVTDGISAESVLWFNKVLVANLKARIGQKVLAVMGQGTARPGQSAPWILVDASSEPTAVKAATEYLEGHARNQFTDTTAAMAADDDVQDMAAASNNMALAAALGKLGARK